MLDLVWFLIQRESHKNIMDIKIMNEVLCHLDEITLDNNTELEVDLADCLRMCLTRIGQIETKLVNQTIEEKG